MAKHLRWMSRALAILLVAALTVHPSGAQLLGSAATAQIVGGNLFCGFVAGVGIGLGIGALVTGGACVFCDVGVLAADLIGAGCALAGA
jgi:hypothetical protein